MTTIPAPRFAARRREASAHILIIDDEPAVRGDVESILLSAGYTVSAAANSDSALRALRQSPADLIVCDIDLGGENGLEIARELQEETMSFDTPLIFLSGAQIPDIVRRAHEAGGTYFLRKPFDPGVLLELAEKALWMPHLVYAPR